MEAAVINHTTTCDMFDRGQSVCSCGWKAEATMQELHDHIKTYGQPTFRLNINGRALTQPADEDIKGLLEDPDRSAQAMDALASGDKHAITTVVGKQQPDLSSGFLAIWIGMSRFTGMISLGDMVNRMYGGGAEIPAKQNTGLKSPSKPRARTSNAKAPAIAEGARVVLQNMSLKHANGATGVCGGLPPRARTRYLFTPDADIVDPSTGKVALKAGAATLVPVRGLKVL